MDTYVFSLGLIPVKDWIAQARRSRDLRAGSVFLWHTMARVLHKLKTELTGVEIWLPRLEPGELDRLSALSFAKALGEDYGLPNRASGTFATECAENVRRIFQGLQAEVTAAWDTLRNEAFEELRATKDSKDFWAALVPHWMAYRTITTVEQESPLSLVWVASPVKGSVEPEALLRPVSERFTDVKRSRTLRPWPQGSPIGKCNQCGQREAIGPVSGFETWRDWHEKRAEDPWIQKGARLDRSERLCFVCLAKRLAGYGSREKFLSTGEVAAGPWLARVESEPQLTSLVGRLRRTALGRSDFGRALYGSVDGLPQEESDEVLKILTELRAAINKTKSPEAAPLSQVPPRYLALLTFDGDDMGRRVVEDFQGVPAGMARFAHAAAELLKKHKGVAFYLAGDEGLAMAPAETALDLALGLREEFTAAFSAAEVTPTLSAGIAFFEYGRPMRGAILAAHGALAEAKSLEGKNALGVTVETASGSRWGFTGPWGDDWKRVREAVRHLQAGCLSPGWAYDVERFLETIPAGDWSPEVAAAARAEVRRLFLRRLKVSGPAAERASERRRVWRELPGDTWWPLDSYGRMTPASPQQFHLIGFLARQGSTQAGETAED